MTFILGDHRKKRRPLFIGKAFAFVKLLNKGGVDSIEKLHSLPKSLLLSMPGFGVKSLESINTRLKANGHTELGDSFKSFNPPDILCGEARALLLEYAYEDSLAKYCFPLLSWGLIVGIGGGNYSITRMGQKVCNRCSILGLY